MIGVEEHIERLSKRLEEVEMVIKWMPELTKQIERLEVKPLIIFFLIILSYCSSDFIK